MNHHEIEQNEIIERYTTHRLQSAERQLFQEHFFECDECFAKVQTSAQFVAGVKHFSRQGLFSEVSIASKIEAISWFDNWFKPAFALASAAAVILAVGLGWVLFQQIPNLREEIARERKVREQISDEKNNSDEKLKKLEAANDIREDAQKFERDAIAAAKAKQAKLQAQLNQITQNKSAPIPVTIEQVQANAPIVLLESQRDAKSESNLLSVPVAAKTATLWIELAPDARFIGYQLQVFDQAKKLVATVNGAKLNSYGALAVNVPTQNLSSAKYLVKAFGQKNGIRELIGEYNLTVQKQ